MKVEEVVSIIDENGKVINHFPKTTQGVTNLMVPYLIAINKFLITKRKFTDDDLESAIYYTVLYKKLFDTVNFEKLKNDLTIYKLYENINRYYTLFSNEYANIVKLETLIINEFTFITNYNFFELDKIEDFDIKIYECRTKRENGEYELLFSYPFAKEILPFILNDMQIEGDINTNVILNYYAISYINELIKRNLIEKNNAFINFITEEYLATEEFLENNVENYDDAKLELINDIQLSFVSEPSVYNNPNIFVDYLYGLFLKNKNIDFFKYLNLIFTTTIEKLPPEKINYDQIIENISNTLYFTKHTDEVKCMDNIKKICGSKAIVNALYIKLYKIYDTPEFKRVFEDKDDNSRGRN